MGSCAPGTYINFAEQSCEAARKSYAQIQIASSLAITGKNKRARASFHEDHGRVPFECGIR
jgi:hypothetical protein